MPRFMHEEKQHQNKWDWNESRAQMHETLLSDSCQFNPKQEKDYFYGGTENSWICKHLHWLPSVLAWKHRRRYHLESWQLCLHTPLRKIIANFPLVADYLLPMFHALGTRPHKRQSTLHSCPWQCVSSSWFWSDRFFVLLIMLIPLVFTSRNMSKSNNTHTRQSGHIPRKNKQSVTSERSSHDTFIYGIDVTENSKKQWRAEGNK